MTKTLRFLSFHRSGLLLTLLAVFSAACVNAQTPTYSFVGTGSNNVFPFGSTTNTQVQWLYTPAEFVGMPAGTITDIYFKLSSATSGSTFTNLTIKMGNTATTAMTASAWQTGLTTVYSASSAVIPAISAGGWMHFTLSTPFYYTGTSNFIIEASQTGYTSGLTIQQDGTLSARRTWGGTGSATPTGSGTGLESVGFDIITTAPCAGTPTTPVITTPVHVKCYNAVDTLSATGSLATLTGITYQWEQSSSLAGPFSSVVGGSGATTLTYYTPALTSTTYYRLKSTCTNSALTSYSTVYKDSVSAPTVTTVTGGAVCNSGTVTLSATGSGTGFAWYAASTGGTALGTSSSFTTPSISATTVYYVAATLGGCGGPRVASTATVNPLPIATSVATNSPYQCTGGTTNLSANAGTGLTYQWRQNGTNITGATSQTYAATSTGNYSVVVTNTTTGCTNTSTPVAVTVGAVPPSAITPAGSAGYCPGSTVTLSTTNAIGLTYQWYNNGSPISGATSASYAAGTAGSYTVNVSAGGSCNSTSAAPTTVAAYNVSPAITSTPNGTGVCPGGTTTISVASVPNSTYQWSLNGTAVSGAIGSSYAVPSAGSYTVAVTNTNSGCTATSAPVVMTASPAPTATASLAGLNNQCDSVLLTSNTGTGLTYQWRQNGAVIGGATNQNYTAIASGNFSVTTTNSFGCSTTSTAVPVVVNASPASSINATGPTTFCMGGIVQLQTNSATGLSYQWYNSGVAVAGATSNFIIASSSGNYTVKVTNSNGCSYITAPVQLIVNPLPTPVITFNAITYKLTVSGNYQNYMWYYNNQPIVGATSNTYTAANYGSYMVSATDSNGCAGFSNPYYLADTTNVPNGIANTAIAAAIKFYPNPTSTVVHIESPVAVQVTVRDLQGRLLMDEKNAREINVATLAKGMYLVLISDMQGRVLRMEKLVKID